MNPIVDFKPDATAAAMRELTAQLDAELEARLKTAIEAFLKAPLDDPETLRGRLGHIDQVGDEISRTYLMDGTPVLWVGPAAITREGDTLTAKRDIRQL